MATFRPAVKKEDSNVQKIIKYIPAEIISGYSVFIGALSVTTNTIPENYTTYYLILLIILTVVTPIWTYFAVLDSDDTNNKKRSLFHAAIATFAFLIWVYAVGNPLLKALICECNTIDCPNCSRYSPAIGSILLGLFTITTPLLERLILGTKLPITKQNN